MDAQPDLDRVKENLEKLWAVNSRFVCIASARNGVMVKEMVER
jgi:hypothetical protein